MVEVKPGQMWVWKQILLKLKDEIWPLTIVTDEARQPGGLIRTLFMRPGDVLLLVKLDDGGPYVPPTIDDFIFSQPKHRHHVIMVQNTLCWIRHDWLVDGSELVQDVA